MCPLFDCSDFNSLDSTRFFSSKQCIYSSRYGETMVTAKTAALTFRIEPGGKEALRAAAHRAPLLGVEKTDETGRPCHMNLDEGKDERI